MSKIEGVAATGGRASAAGEVWETVKTVGGALLIALVLRTLLFQPFTIPSASEEPNLYEGDYIVVSKWDYGYSRHSILFSPHLFDGRLFDHAPRRGDVIVFKQPATGKDFIKRLVGLPGDRIQVRAGRLFVNGQALPLGPARDAVLTDRQESEPGRYVPETNLDGRTYLTQRRGDGTSPADNTAIYVVPAHCFFMMGDNRQNSLDSRFDPELPPGDPRLGGCAWNPEVDDAVPPAIGANGGFESGVGFVPEANLEGRARMVLLSWRKGAALWLPWTWLDLRWNRFLRPIH